MEVIRVMVKEGGVAAITCPNCMDDNSLSVADFFAAGKRTLKIKCRCREFFIICPELRRHQRKATDLLGQSTNLTNQSGKQDIIAASISPGGIAFYPFKRHHARDDDQISFILNEIQNTPIDAHVTVRTSTDDRIGGEFKSIEKFREPLSFFISPGANNLG